MEITDFDRWAGSYLKEKRKSAKYRQLDCARWIEVTTSVYNRKENGQIPITFGEFCYILSQLNTLPPRLKPCKIRTEDILEILPLKK